MRRTPRVNHWLIGLNGALFLLLSEPLAQAFKAVGGSALLKLKNELVLYSAEPSFHQFITYQFLHADVWHLLSNMLFLWVFGNAVNSKMGNWAYLLFYLGGGIFAAWGMSVLQHEPFQLIGASGAIAAITTAYLVLFPRSRVTVMLWLFFFIHFFEWPALLLIGLKIVLWDNILGPQIMPSAGGNVAYGAHLGGYLFGFCGALFMLLVKALPRDEFDIIALWSRWKRRREMASAMSGHSSVEEARYGRVKAPPMNVQEAAVADARMDEISEIRATVADCLARGAADEATEAYQRLIEKDVRQCLSERNQLQIARQFYGTGRFPQAASAFARFIETYPRSSDIGDVTLLLGIIYARDLRQFEHADRYLTLSMDKLTDAQRRSQCTNWLADVRAALGLPAPEA